MKRVIKGQIYDTQIAEPVHSYVSGQPYEPGWFEEELYRTDSGAFFLFGEGGSQSPYAAYYCGSKVNGARIKPLTPSFARIWLERVGANAEIVEHVFPR